MFKMLANNIKYLRKKFELTQGEFADKLGIKRASVGSYEESRAEPKIITLKKIANLFSYSLDDLVFTDLSKHENMVKPIDVKGDNLRVLSLVTDKEGVEKIQLVSQKVSAGYVNGFSDPEFLANLSTLSLPMLGNSASYRAFEIKGDSMLPIDSGAVVVGKYVDDWNNLKDNCSYIVVTNSDGTVFKRILNTIKQNGTIVLNSDNQIYSSYEVAVEEIKEIWEASLIISKPKMKESIEKNEDIVSLTNLVLNLKEEIQEIKEKL